VRGGGCKVAPYSIALGPGAPGGLRSAACGWNEEADTGAVEKPASGQCGYQPADGAGKLQTTGERDREIEGQRDRVTEPDLLYELETRN